MDQITLINRDNNIYSRNQWSYQRQRGVLRWFCTIILSMSIMNGLLISNAIFGTFLYIETRIMYNAKARASVISRQNKRKPSEETIVSEEQEYEILYILGHYFKREPKTKKKLKCFIVQWLGFTPENGGIDGIPESHLLPNASSLLASYNEFCQLYGNPYLNPKKTKMVKEYLAPSVTGYKQGKRRKIDESCISVKGFNTSMVMNNFAKLEQYNSYSENMGFIYSLQKIKGKDSYLNKNQLELLTWRNLCINWSNSNYTVITHPLGVNGINHNKAKRDEKMLKNYYSDIQEYTPFPSNRFKFLLNNYWKCIKPLIILMFASGRIAQNRHALVCVINRDDQGFILRYFDPWEKSAQPLTALLRNTRKEFKYKTTRSFICFGNQTGADRSCYKRVMLIIAQLLDNRGIETFGPWHKI